MSVVTATILSEGQQMPAAYELVAIDITRAVNRIPYAQLVLLDGDVARQTFAISNAAFFEPGRTIEIRLRHEDAPEQEATLFKGVVIGHGVQADRYGSLLTIDLKDAAVKLTRSRRSQVFRDKTDDRIIGEIIANAGLKKGTMAATEAQHQELVQYYCTDWDFILARAEANGLLLIADNGEISLSEIALDGQPQHTFEYGLDDIYEFEIEAEAGYQYPDVQSTAWDIKNQTLTKPAKAASFKLAQGNLDGQKLGAAVGLENQLLTSAVPLEAKELQAWADGSLARSRLAMLRGRIGGPGIGQLALLDVIEVAGIGERFNGQTLVTGLRHRVDQHGWQTDIQFGLAPETFAERRDLSDAPAAGLLPAVNGLQVGVVDQFEEDPAREFRVRVILPGVDDKQGAVWARLAAPEAGPGRGYFFRPEPGDEVVVGFFNDDPRQAVILGALYGSKNSPPEALAELSAENIDKGIVTKSGATIRFVDGEKPALFIETPASRTIVLDDAAETIQISDPHGNQIIMSKDGIEIKSAKDLTLDAGSGNVQISGQKVDVK